MYKTLLGIPATAYVFLSGLMVSVATSAAAQIAFAENVASNRGKVAATGVLALIAGILWFLLSEKLASADRAVDALAPAMKSRETAIDSLPPRSKKIAVSLFFVACCFSLAWPWTSQLGHLIRRAYESL
jgi:hypothetical protein